ncbi:exodeoxyribonuclease V alpha subunit [Streptococcus sanguinis SK1 = NCTC 7863]|uniref:SF1B family DNA helicase RecD2 n=1 Tax=Streptococcus sanguinis TaxID=1305 RepID=UPI000204C805|nr:ATP-dependent RecD-like DNA helicase [Streptococcus sanguinis]EGF05816.1 exodeoxyribonuclease V alpha subunit [Streptococcus sanguinis SK1 = NCTC 7863]EGF22450.1 exodeoxyribonuclease V alpha subunit [Streptococcus sanguinis SK1058]MBZ2075999.1 ATP-dependent RecD-like DNA helicase [Streptococcus sanguinis]MCY7014394.1 ATP-dependent RecD-like DNA helicase [Streptococcus sanguinis]RSI29001.1 ATP-dependent RecD-like DNA helicase [Streptococcus sanguinis]
MEFYFSGTIERIIFENPSNFFRILLLDIENTDAEDFEDFEIIVTGSMADVMEGEDYSFWGSLVQHPKYGQQLKISRYERAKPSSKGLVKYFSSDHFKGIGVKTAQKIVQLYGEDTEDTIDKILADPEKLTQINGLAAKNREAFVAKLRLNYGTEMVLAKLAAYGIPNKLAFQIQDTYKEETLDIVEKYPYQLVEDIQGIGFKIADHLAEELGIQSDAPERFRAGLVHTLLTQSMERGDTYVEARDLLEHTIELLESSRQVELNPSLVADELAHLIEEDKVQNVETKIFENSLFFAEEGIKSNLVRLLEKGEQDCFDADNITAAIQQVEESSGISYDSIQKEAIRQAINQKVFILTGGPGTGKTTVINCIIAVYAQLRGLDLRKVNDLPILLAAPTGRAARRMNELTGLPSATIHRHLGMTGDDDTSHLDDYLDADFIIVDEFSMVDTWLANQLLSNISSQTKLLIVGDADQLPSVSPGQVLADLLQIPTIPQTKLETIYRQSEESTIVTLASQIQKGILPADFTDKKADRSYFEARNEHIPPMIEKIASAAIRSGIPAQDVQVLAPMYRGPAGIDQINNLMQNLINPVEKEELTFEAPDCQYRQGDRVIHLVNDAESNVFNGDLGYITDLLPGKYTDSKQDELTIDFDGNELVYQRSEWYKIRLAYAMSIHKSQGSEFPVVILPITKSSHRMLQRNLIYTAITRAKSKLILLGEKVAFDYAVKNTGTARKTYLIERFGDFPQAESNIHNTVDKMKAPVENYVLTEENFQKIDPMIGIREEDIKGIFK